LQILLYLVFTLSGAAGLIYESIWSHYLGLFVGLMTNGKPDASLTADWFVDGEANEPRRALRRDAATQTLLALVSLAYAPHARNVAVIGQGSGQSSHLLLGSPYIERFVIIGFDHRVGHFWPLRMTG
jgi:hypothetical protein